MKNYLVIISIAFLSLGMVSNAAATFLGNDVINRSSVDGASNINFIDSNLAFAYNGKVTSWKIFAGRASSEFALQVFRSTGTTNEYTLIGSNYFSSAGGTGVQNYSIAAANQINVLAGDVIGWWFGSGQGVIDYSNGNGLTQWKYEGAHINVGDDVTFSGSGARTYSIEATYVPEPGTLALLGLGLAGLGFARRKKA
jgi:hypothetical protein